VWSIVGGFFRLAFAFLKNNSLALTNALAYHNSLPLNFIVEILSEMICVSVVSFV
jgi:hypothetical protein